MDSKQKKRQREARRRERHALKESEKHQGYRDHMGLNLQTSLTSILAHALFRTLDKAQIYKIAVDPCAGIISIADMEKTCNVFGEKIRETKPYIDFSEELFHFQKDHEKSNTVPDMGIDLEPVEEQIRDLYMAIAETCRISSRMLLHPNGTPGVIQINAFNEE